MRKHSGLEVQLCSSHRLNGRKNVTSTQSNFSGPTLVMSFEAEKVARRVGTAGRCGPEVRSVLHVQVELRESGGITIKLESRVQAYYGDSIRQLAIVVLKALKVQH